MSEQPTISEFLRASGEVLERVSREDVVLKRRDGADILISTQARSEALVHALGILGHLARHATEAFPDVMGDLADHAAGWLTMLDPTERLRFVDELAAAAVGAAELGLRSRPGEVLERWRERARTNVTPAVRPVELRPVAIPSDVDDPRSVKANGVVTLPLHVQWSGPSRSYDLDDPCQLRIAYEQVLQEGTDEDVRRFIDVDKLVEHWADLVLPRRVRSAWAHWLRVHRGIDVAC